MDALTPRRLVCFAMLTRSDRGESRFLKYSLSSFKPSLSFLAWALTSSVSSKFSDKVLSSVILSIIPFV